ncbi:hypothetical protein ACWDPV_10105 [Gordonia sp. NPDC003504]
MADPERLGIVVAGDHHADAARMPPGCRTGARRADPAPPPSVTAVTVAATGFASRADGRR